MTSVRPKTSQSWYMPTADRRDLYVARHLAGVSELVRVLLATAGVDVEAMGEGYRDQLEDGLRRILVDAFNEGAKHEDGLRTAVHTQRVIQRQLEALLRAHGIAVPLSRLGGNDDPG